MQSLQRRWTTVAAAMAALLMGWVARDLWAGTVHSARDFDPHEVARLETDAWRSYYGHQKCRLFAQMAELLRTQYHMPFWRSWVAAYAAAHAAVVFQPGHSRADYERAMPDLVRFYRLIHQGSDTDFPVEEVARLELEWWIVHRERNERAPGDLEHALARLQSRFYGRPESIFQEHAQARAEAMAIRDGGAETGAVTEADWAHIRQLLERSWGSLQAAVAR